MRVVEPGRSVAARGRAVLGALLAALVGLSLVGACSAPAATAAPVGTAAATSVPGSGSGLPVTALSALPPAAAATFALIQRGGPFPYGQDGVVFQNRERVLPAQAGGFYHEYTVRTPGSGDRGARRIITGGGVGPSQQIFYTGDHYASFTVVDVSR